MRRVILLFLFVICANMMFAQFTEFQQLQERYQKRFQQFRSSQQEKFDEYRKKQNQRYGDFMREQWQKFNSMPAVKPKEEKPQIIKPKEEKSQTKVNSSSSKNLISFVL